MEARGLRGLDVHVAEQPCGPLLVGRIDEQRQGVDPGRPGAEEGRHRVVDPELAQETIDGGPKGCVVLLRQDLLDGLEADRLAGLARLGDARLHRPDHRQGRVVDRVHQPVRQPHLGDPLFDQLLALAVDRAIVVVEAPDAHALGLGHLLDQGLERLQRLGPRDRVRREHPPVGRVVQVIDPRKRGTHWAQDDRGLRRCPWLSRERQV